jgi:hypothetical protein
MIPPAPAPAPKPTQQPRVPAASPAITLECRFSISLERAPSEMRVGAVRVAIKRATSGAKSYSVEELAKGQHLPPGTIEGILVIPGDVDGTRGSTLNQNSNRVPPKR